MAFANYDIAREFIGRAARIEYNDSFDLAQLASKLLMQCDQERYGRDLIIRMKDAIIKGLVAEQTLPMWNELMAAAGLYPYVDQQALNTASLIRCMAHKSDNLEGVFFHEEQLSLSLELEEGKPVILSAPTSYGKSLLIEDIVASGRYRNIVIIQPTLALLDETRKKLSNYRERYKVLVATSQDPAEDIGNIFLFTAERVVEYDRFASIDFFVIDEFYKLSMDREDDRAIVLNQALYKLLKFTRQFYMLGPSIKDIPDVVKEKLGVVWQKTDFATVAVDERTVSSKTKKLRKEERKEQLFELLLQLSEPTLVYVASPASCTELAIDFINYRSLHVKGHDTPVPPDISYMCEWIGEHLHKGWSLMTALKNGIAFHHGAMPRHLGGSIVDAFNRRQIQYLFCTATLIEGVNTSAKNVVLFDRKKGKKPIDYFDYKNIAGRSGRMTQYYIGNVYRFDDEPPEFDFEVDIPIISQDNAPLEILLAIDQQDLKPALSKKLQVFNGLPAELQQILKKNLSVNINGQLSLLKELESKVTYYHSRLNWSGAYPTYYQLLEVIALAWTFLAGNEDERMRIGGIGNLSDRWLCGFAFGYHRSGSLGQLINETVNNDFWITKIPDKQQRINAVTFSILHVARTYFDYKLPKWISIVNGLQQYVFQRHGMTPGNFTAFASRLENGLLDPSLATLQEYDIPITAIRKLASHLRDYYSAEQNIRNINRLTDHELRRQGLLDYEISKLHQAL